MKTRVVTEKALFDLKFQTMDIDRTYKYSHLYIFYIGED